MVALSLNWSRKYKVESESGTARNFLYHLQTAFNKVLRRKSRSSRMLGSSYNVGRSSPKRTATQWVQNSLIYPGRPKFLWPVRVRIVSVRSNHSEIEHGLEALPTPAFSWPAFLGGCYVYNEPLKVAYDYKSSRFCDQNEGAGSVGWCYWAPCRCRCECQQSVGLKRSHTRPIELST